ncbi:MAG: hypothetical protein ABIO65_09695, partial [Nitrospiria bacterium]
VPRHCRDFPQRGQLKGPMRRICAWCRSRLDDTDAGDPTPTHGICPPCRDRLSREWELFSAGETPRPTVRDRLAARWRFIRRTLIVAVGRLTRPRRLF